MWLCFAKQKRCFRVGKHFHEQLKVSSRFPWLKLARVFPKECFTGWHRRPFFYSFAYSITAKSICLPFTQRSSAIHCMAGRNPQSSVQKYFFPGILKPSKQKHNKTFQELTLCHFILHQLRNTMNTKLQRAIIGVKYISTIRNA